MKIFIPFTKLRSEVVMAVAKTGIDYELVPLIKYTDYSKFLKRRWEEGKTFINVEHDVIIPGKEIMESMWNCDKPLCVTGYTYRYREANPPEVTFLGCVKIGADLIKNSQGLFDEPAPWSVCDGFITRASNEEYCYHGETIHMHGE